MSPPPASHSEDPASAALGWQVKVSRTGTARSWPDLLHGATSEGVPVSGGALFARAGNQLIMVNRAGETAGCVRLPAPIDRLLPDGRSLVHAIGKGHLTTIDISTTPT